NDIRIPMRRWRGRRCQRRVDGRRGGRRGRGMPRAPRGENGDCKQEPRHPYSFVLVRPKIATTSVSSLVTLRSFHPRLRMSVRQPMSFSHSWTVVRKTRRSATVSQCGGYGVECEGGVAGVAGVVAGGSFVVTGEEVVRP